MPLYFSIPTNEGSIDCPCCFMLPKVDTQAPGGEAMGSTSAYICDQNLCVPKLKYSENNQDVYILKPKTCCGGCCVACSCSGNGFGSLSFFFHKPGEGDKPIGPRLPFSSSHTSTQTHAPP